MEKIQNIVEYYDEIYPVTEEQISFFNEESSCFEKPVKFLRIGCGTGMLELELAHQGADVTGIEPFKELLDSANRHRRTQLMTIRFFLMSTLEINRFLGKGFYNVISCLDNRIELIDDPILMRKFFFDTKELLAKNGKLILKLRNFDLIKNSVEQMPEVSNIRINFKTQIKTLDDGTKLLDQEIRTGNGHVYPVFKDTKIYPLTKNEIVNFAKEVGFKNFQFYANYKKEEFTPDSPELIAVIS